jgi:fatty acid desaturase
MVQKNKNNFAYKLLIIIIIQALSIMLIKSSSFSLKLAGVILLGLINAHSVQIIHQCSHFLGFKNKKINDIVGSLLGLQVFINFGSYREVHFQHHKKLGTAEDTEFFGLDKLNKASNILQIVQCFFGLSKYKDLLTGILKKKDATTGSILGNVVFLNLIIIGGLIFLGQSDIVISWIVSLILITEPVHFLIEIPEHYGCKKISKEKYENTRTIKSASKLARWFTNWNNFHVEHHLNQWIFPEDLEPFYNEEKANRYNPRFNNYFEFYSFFVKDLMKSGTK